eukprot:GHRQ01007683.1.p3 GENE.GHRQ01007683.1~~GHRQ01007683.1.p3  ORF type:complete len:135 (-),score=32.11 GHRQ01007683.1:503-907(-)
MQQLDAVQPLTCCLCCASCHTVRIKHTNLLCTSGAHTRPVPFYTEMQSWAIPVVLADSAQCSKDITSAELPHSCERILHTPAAASAAAKAAGSRISSALLCSSQGVAPELCCGIKVQLNCAAAGPMLQLKCCDE